MSRIVLWLQNFALQLGGPGLFLIAFLDSSFLSLPEINDILIVWMVTRHKERMVLYASMATLGSIAGCLVLYYLGRKGGEALVRRRFNEKQVEWAFGLFRRYGVMAIIIPALLPPPAPFKVFVLLAGIAGVSPMAFTLSIAVGRGVRYFGEGLLAVWYGDLAIDYIRRNGPRISLALAMAVLLGGIAYFTWRRMRRPPGGSAGDVDQSPLPPL